VLDSGTRMLASSEAVGCHAGEREPLDMAIFALNHRAQFSGWEEFAEKSDCAGRAAARGFAIQRTISAETPGDIVFGLLFARLAEDLLGRPGFDQFALEEE